MAAVGSDLDKVLVGEREHWQQGPPHELFKRLRAQGTTLPDTAIAAPKRIAIDDSSAHSRMAIIPASGP